MPTDEQDPIPASGEENSESLLQRIVLLERTIHDLQEQVAELRGPLKRVFLARQGATSTIQFQERCVNNGVLSDYADGRLCTSDADPAAIVDNLGAMTLIEVEDPFATQPTYRYLQVGPGSGEYQYDVLTMVSQNRPGWGYLRLAPLRS